MEENESKEELKQEEVKQEETKQEEVKQEETKKIDTEDLKKEATDTVGQMKDTIKDIKFKDETKNATNFVKDMVKDPITKTSEITKDSDNKFLKTSIFMVIIWVAARLLYRIFSYKYGSFGSKLLTIIKYTVAPLFVVLALTLIIFILNKKRRKSLTTIFSTVVTVYTPVILASVVDLLNLIDYQMVKITTPVSQLATFISIVLSYFAMKDIFEENSELATFKKFVLVELIYFAVAIVVSFLGVSMYL